MAEQIPFSIMELILFKLGSLAAQKIGSMYGIAEELRKLEEKLGTIKAVLLDAEEKQEKSTAVQHWLRRLKDVVYDADDLLDDFATHHLQPGGLARQVRHLFSLPNQVAFRFKMSHRIKDIKDRLHDIAEDICMLNLIPRDAQRRVESSGRETHSFVLTSEIVGRDENKEEIIRLLVSSDNEKNHSVVAIVGIGGLGKTTLAQLVYNDRRVTEYFELKIWIHVSDNFDVKMLVRKILESLSCGLVENLEFDVLKSRLHEKLMEKKYLLVLDDLWNQSFEKWDQLRILLMVGREGGKILVTTRETKVASVMGVNSPFFLRGLEENQSWELFLQMSLIGGQEKEKMRLQLMDIGKEIISMSSGVPLVIKVLGRLMLQFETEESRRLFMKNNKNLMSMQDGNDNVLSTLKLSYDNLPIHLKPCFAYCSLFPKNYLIEKKSLVQLWMAQGYIQSSCGDEHLEDIGNQYFEELLSRSLFEKHAYNNMRHYKMHDLIHDLAQSVMGSDVLILEDGVKNVSKRFHHVSLFKPLRTVTKGFNAKSLRTFFMFYGDASIVNILIPSCKSLRVLKLEILKVGKVPKSMEKLSHLRYLDLSYNGFEALPNAVAKLKNLQTLRVVGCRNLKELPKGIKELVNLRHLENDGCRCLTHMPSGIGQLTSLHSLSLFVVGNASVDAKHHSIASLSELKCLNHLRGELWIQRIENARDSAIETKEAILKGKQYLQSLKLEWGRSEVEANEVELVMERLHPHPNLKKLCIIGCKAERLPSWMMNDRLDSFLPSLESLELYGMEKVEYMMDGCSSTVLFFPSLQILKLDNLCKLKGLWRTDLPAENVASFPCLSKLYIHDCPNLTSLPLSSFPGLSELCVSSCENLQHLLLPSSSSLHKLELCSCRNLTSLLLPSTFPCLSKLTIRHCFSLTSLTLPSSTPYLSELCISGCDNLTSLLLPSSRYLSSLHISGFPKLTALPTLACASPLHVHHCPNLTSLALPSSPFLSQLRIENCRNLTSLEVPSSPVFPNCI